MKNCTHCGAIQEEDIVFCSECGKKQTPKKKTGSLVWALVIVAAIVVVGGVGIAAGMGALEAWFNRTNPVETVDVATEEASSGSGAVAKAKEAIANGDYKTAFVLLKHVDSDEAKAMLNKFAFVPTHMVTSDREYTNRYDGNGNRIAFETVTSEGSFLRIRYTFDDNNLLIDEEWTDNDPASFSIRYTYENGLAVKKDSYSDGVLVYSETYVYDEGGHCLTTTCREENGEISLVINNTYDENGYLLTNERVSANGDQEKTIWTYDDQYREIHRTITTNDGYYCGTLYTYTENKKIEETTANDDTWTKIVYTFRNDVMVTASYEDSSGTYNISEYSYDENGNLWEQDEMQTGGKHLIRTYCYDEDHNRTSYVYCEDGNVAEKAEWEWALMYYPNGVPEHVHSLIADALAIV